MPFSRRLGIFDKELCISRMTFAKKDYHNSDRILSHPIALSLNAVSKQKIKMKTRNTMALSYHSRFRSTQNIEITLHAQNKEVSFLSFLAHGILPSCSGKVNVF